MAVFADADEPELAREFMSFMLEPDVQGVIAERNVAFRDRHGRAPRRLRRTGAGAVRTGDVHVRRAPRLGQ